MTRAQDQRPTAPDVTFTAPDITGRDVVWTIASIRRATRTTATITLEDTGPFDHNVRLVAHYTADGLTLHYSPSAQVGRIAAAAQPLLHDLPVLAQLLRRELTRARATAAAAGDLPATHETPAAHAQRLANAERHAHLLLATYELPDPLARTMALHLLRRGYSGTVADLTATATACTTPAAL